MAQNERQGVGTEKGGTAGEKAGAESTGSVAASRAASAQGSETTGEQGTGTGREQGQAGGRLSRREGWDDPISGFFGGSPFALFRRLSDDMDRLFFGGGQGLGAFGGLGFGGRFLPHIDINERDGKLVVNADLPGVRPEDFQVEIEGDALVLQGERRSEQEDTRGGIRRSERTYGTFRRVIPLPPGANAEAAEARFENGVLVISIPFSQQSRTRRLEVKSGGSEGTTAGTSGDPTRH
jgi:HSP20 family protein